MKLPDMRDDFVQLKDIAYYESRLKMGVWRRHHNDFDSVKMWALEPPYDVFIWHKKDDIIELPFIIGIQTPWQKKWCSSMDTMEPLQRTQHLEPMFQSIVFIVDVWRLEK